MRHELQSVRISIHAPAWGATQGYCKQWKFHDKFQSTRPRGARLVATSDAYYSQSISIHAPAWGATSISYYDARRAHFNPRARVGRDAMRYSTSAERLEFQSTRPRGARPSAPVSCCTRRLFQSTRPRGARLQRVISGCTCCRFQSTRPRGARPCAACARHTDCPFQSTRPRGARRAALSGGAVRMEFQSTRPRGARHLFKPLIKAMM